MLSRIANIVSFLTVGALVGVLGKSLDVTLVSHTSSDRIWMASEICSRWPGLFILSVFIIPAESASPLVRPSSCGNRLSIIEYFAASADEVNEYPVNKLRNAAIGSANTTHVLMIDFDFWPSTGLYTEILRHSALSFDPKLSLIVPAFARHGSSCSTLEKCRELSNQDGFVPRNLKDLGECIEAKKCAVFQEQNNLEGHSTTRSAEWLTASAYWREPRSVTCFKSHRYEPYLVTPVFIFSMFDKLTDFRYLPLLEIIFVCFTVTTRRSRRWPGLRCTTLAS